LVALRVENWKIVFLEQRAPGTLLVWSEPFTPLRVPKLFDLHADPYERADITSNTYYDWLGRVPGDVQGISTGTAAGLLHHQSGNGEAKTEPRRLMAVGLAPTLHSG
jgi:hypothetical protein